MIRKPLIDGPVRLFGDPERPSTWWLETQDGMHLMGADRLVEEAWPIQMQVIWAMVEAYNAQPAALGGVPQGWRIERCADDSLCIWTPSGGGCTVGPNEFDPRTIPAQVLFRLARDLLSAAPAQDAPSAQDARDAARYRWLRAGLNGDNWERVYDVTGSHLLDGDELDAAIDTAMAGGESEGEAAR